MAIFGVNQDQLISIKGVIENCMAEYDSVVSDMNAHAESINASWDGDAATVFESQMNNARTLLSQMGQIVLEYSAFLKTTSDEYNHADDEADAIVKAL